MTNEETIPDNRAVLQERAVKLKSLYDDLLKGGSNLFPKVDQRLLMDVLKFGTTYDDWEGSVMLKIVYPAEKIDIEKKKDWLYTRYQRVATIEEDRTLRVKVIRMYLEDIEKLLADDPDIEYITGSATLTPTDAYSA
jgi:hypothetical protein